MNAAFIDDMISESNGTDETMQVVAFMAGGSIFAVDIAYVSSIVMPHTISEIPDSPSYIIGNIDLRGRNIPVLSLGGRFGLNGSSKTARMQERVLVVDVEGIVVGLRVDSISEVLHLPLSRLKPPTELVKGVDRECVSGVGRTDDNRILIVLDLSKTLACSMDLLAAFQTPQTCITQPDSTRMKAA